MKYYNVRFEVLKLAVMKSSVFWDMSCTPLKISDKYYHVIECDYIRVLDQ
jgi:hypothetical protein